ncbi:MAG: ABC transporter ATP-binding protein [Clostridia bacterium]|nr:ABC transporter ATP-binding protein [Clostridia bacterium]
MVGEVAMDLWQPDLMAKIVDQGVLQSNFSLIVRVGVQMILCVLAGGTFGVVCGVFANIAAQGFGNDLRKDLFGHIMSLSFEQTDRFSTGSLITRLSNDVTQVQNMVGLAIRGLVRNGVMFFGGVFMLWRQSPRFALVAAFGMPFLICLILFFLRRAAPLFRTVQEKLDGVNHVMQEDVAGARVVKAYVKEDYELGRFDRANDALCRENLRVQTLLAFIGPGMNIIMNLCVVAVILVGGITVKNGGDLTPGSIMAAITYLTQILGGFGFMAMIFQNFTRAKASAERINEVLTSQPVLADGANEQSETEHGTVEFRDVSFAYPGTTQNVLEHIDLTVKQGETLAIIGATGSGKSTLIDLIPRFYDVSAGEVLVNGKNVRDYTLTALRDKISVVMQRTELYSRSLEENIRWGAPDAEPEQIKAAARVAQADDYICEKEYGYYTPVSEGGHSLSGGQKQRVSVARAILKPHEILIFDDATSALDLRTEAALYTALKEQDPTSTKIIIAQRIASIRNADRIIVLDNGKIAADGTHEALMESSDIYRDIYLSQQKEGGAA